MKLLKILTFPLRLILFLAVALISGVLFLIDQTVCLLCVYASYVVRVIGLLIMLPAAGFGTLTVFRDYERLTENRPIIEWVIFVALLWLVVLFLAFLPAFSGKLYVWLGYAAVFLWKAAKIILLGKKENKEVYKSKEKLERDEEYVIYIENENEEKDALTELQEMSKLLNLFSDYGVTSVDELKEKIAEEKNKNADSLSEIQEMSKVSSQTNQFTDNSVNPVNLDIQEEIEDIEIW